MMLLIRIPLGHRQIPAEFLCRSAWTIAGGIALDAPPLFQRARIHRIEAELVEQMGYSGLRIFVVTSDDQRATILCASRLSVSSKGSGMNMVEGLDDLRGWQMCLQEFGRGGRFVVELGDVAIPLRVVIVGVDHNFARQGLGRNLPVVLQ